MSKLNLNNNVVIIGTKNMEAYKIAFKKASKNNHHVVILARGKKGILKAIDLHNWARKIGNYILHEVILGSIEVPNGNNGEKVTLHTIKIVMKKKIQHVACLIPILTAWTIFRTCVMPTVTPIIDTSLLVGILDLIFGR